MSDELTENLEQEAAKTALTQLISEIGENNPQAVARNLSDVTVYLLESAYSPVIAQQVLKIYDQWINGPNQTGNAEIDEAVYHFNKDVDAIANADPNDYQLSIVLQGSHGYDVLHLSSSSAFGPGRVGFTGGKAETAAFQKIMPASE